MKRKKIVIGVIVALIGMITTYAVINGVRKPAPTNVGNISANESSTDSTTQAPTNNANADTSNKQQESDGSKLESNAYKVAQMLSNGDYAYTLSGYDDLSKMAKDYNITLDDSCKVPFAYGTQAGYVAVASVNTNSTQSKSGNEIQVTNTIVHGIISSKEAQGDDDTLRSIAIASLDNLANKDAHTDNVNYVIILSSDGTSATIKCLNPEVFTK